MGCWRLGGDTVSGWPNAGTNGYFNGSVDEVAIYKHELTPTEIADHYAKGASTPVGNLNPAASFTTAVDGFDLDVDGSASSDPDGTITSYAWDFGDGEHRDRCQPAAHTYATSGHQDVKLTVTDNEGGVGTPTKQVLINTAPNADFTATRERQRGGLQRLDVRPTPENNITSYAWTFGDGSNPASGSQPGAEQDLRQQRDLRRHADGHRRRRADRQRHQAGHGRGSQPAAGGGVHHRHAGSQGRRSTGPVRPIRTATRSPPTPGTFGDGGT